MCSGRTSGPHHASVLLEKVRARTGAPLAFSIYRQESASLSPYAKCLHDEFLLAASGCLAASRNLSHPSAASMVRVRLLAPPMLPVQGSAARALGYARQHGPPAGRPARLCAISRPAEATCDDRREVVRRGEACARAPLVADTRARAVPARRQAGRCRRADSSRGRRRAAHEIVATARARRWPSSPRSSNQPLPSRTRLR